MGLSHQLISWRSTFSAWRFGAGLVAAAMVAIGLTAVISAPAQAISTTIRFDYTGGEQKFVVP